MSDRLPFWERVDPVEGRAALVEMITKRNDLFELFQPKEIAHVVEWMFNNRAWTPDAGTVRRLREWGEPLSDDQRRALYMPAHGPVVGDMFALRLSSHGLADPVTAASAILYWPIHELAQGVVINELHENAAQAYYDIDTRTCCRAAMAYAGGVCLAHEIEAFPHSTCTNPICACTITPYNFDAHGEIVKDLRNPIIMRQIGQVIDNQLKQGAELVRAHVDAIEAVKGPRDIIIIVLSLIAVCLAGFLWVKTQ